ncbi:MAG TPA: hypothetical protein VNM46_01665, partial [Xanthobacteraceae bacterium]|nr:hypothetical protein [Xanthobacteraceae bacterium]
HGPIQALANADEVRRPNERHKLQHPRADDSLLMLFKEKPSHVTPAAEIARVMPKGRNFH